MLECIGRYINTYIFIIFNICSTSTFFFLYLLFVDVDFLDVINKKFYMQYIHKRIIHIHTLENELHKKKYPRLNF